MEAKLEEYRARKRKEGTKQYLYNMMSLKSPYESDKTNLSGSPLLQEDGNMSDSSLISYASEDAESIESNMSEVQISCPKFTTFTVITYVLYTLLWTTLYAIAIHFEFGTVYLIVSLLYAIWINTRTGPKKKDEVSAYSVFNPNCEAINGTLKAEQFERELRYGAVSVH